MAALSLRPLPLGELLDRAFTLYFRHIIAFSALLGVVLLPSLLVSYLQTRNILDFYISTMQKVITSPNSPPDLSGLSSLAPSDLLTVLNLLLGVVVVPLSYGAVVIGVSRAYVGLPVTFADCYRPALRRWFAVVMLVLLWAVFVFFAVIGIVIVAAIIGASIGALGAALGSSVIGVVLAILFLVVFAAAFGFTIMLYLTSAVSFISVVLENLDPPRAVGEAFSRVFGGKRFWRSFLLAVAIAGIYFGAFLVIAGGGALLAYLLKSPAIYVIFLGLMQLFFVPFAVVTAAVYYYDIRIRRDGLDLQMLIERVTNPTQPSAPSA
ncbi:MAG TPA: hypothetical protein VEJ41_04710 [Candidatus Acidoferrales bacterium]|nr:hypothetical protein [Candidatus Acidoferrales bacterium]